MTKTNLFVLPFLFSLLPGAPSAFAHPECPDLAGQYRCYYSHPVHFKLTISQKESERYTIYNVATTEFVNGGTSFPDEVHETRAIAVDEAGPSQAFCVSGRLFSYEPDPSGTYKALYYWTRDRTFLDRAQVGHPFNQFQCDKIESENT
jgi:hypothetical protein